MAVIERSTKGGIHIEIVNITIKEKKTFSMNGLKCCSYNLKKLYVYIFILLFKLQTLHQWRVCVCFCMKRFRQAWEKWADKKLIKLLRFEFEMM
jgi:hypothetical protein